MLNPADAPDNAYMAFYEELLTLMPRLAQKHGLNAADFPAEITADGLRLNALVQAQAPEQFWRTNYLSWRESLQMEAGWLDKWVRNTRTQRRLQIVGLYRPLATALVVLKDPEGQVYLLKPGAVRYLVKESGVSA